MKEGRTLPRVVLTGREQPVGRRERPRRNPQSGGAKDPVPLVLERTLGSPVACARPPVQGPVADDDPGETRMDRRGGMPDHGTDRLAPESDLAVVPEREAEGPREVRLVDPILGVADDAVDFGQGDARVVGRPATAWPSSRRC